MSRKGKPVPDNRLVVYGDPVEESDRGVAKKFVIDPHGTTGRSAA